MYQSALTELGQSFASNADNASYPFDTKETFANPWYQFNEQRDDISFRYSTMNTMMSNLNDPRTWIINDTLDPNSPTDGLGPQYGAINSPVEFITYEETQFMTAEAQYATGGTVAAKTAYLNGMAASMQKLGVDSASAAIYIAANSSLTSANYLQQIASQEYISLYLNPEAWVLWRRTGYPALTPVAGSNVPRRLLYPQSELDYNAKNTPAATLFTPKIFWDK
jgi:hypothetical protein